MTDTLSVAKARFAPGDLVKVRVQADDVRGPFALSAIHTGGGIDPSGANTDGVYVHELRVDGTPDTRFVRRFHPGLVGEIIPA